MRPFVDLLLVQDIKCSSSLLLYVTAFPFYSNFIWFCLSGAGYGLGLGVTISLWATLLIQSVGIEIYVPAVCACGLTMAIAFLIAGPVFGEQVFLVYSL